MSENIENIENTHIRDAIIWVVTFVLLGGTFSTLAVLYWIYGVPEIIRSWNETQWEYTIVYVLLILFGLGVTYLAVRIIMKCIQQFIVEVNLYKLRKNDPVAYMRNFEQEELKEWFCQECGTRNPGETEECEKCGERKK